MTDDEKRITIARACPHLYISDGYVCKRAPGGGSLVVDILNDLNAMHEALQTLSSRQMWEALDLVRKQVVRPNSSLDRADVIDAIRAPVGEWVDAFLKVKGLWKDEWGKPFGPEGWDE